jgi:hypothetical protein
MAVNRMIRKIKKGARKVGKFAKGVLRGGLREGLGEEYPGNIKARKREPIIRAIKKERGLK